MAAPAAQVASQPPQSQATDPKADPAIRVLVLTGRGKSFSSGFHLGVLSGREKAEAPAQAPSPEENAFEAMCDKLEDLRVPTIVALNGPVYGGSTDLALACDFRIGVDAGGYWHELINTDAKVYGGSGLGNQGGVHAAAVSSHGRPYSLSLTLPPLGALFLSRG